MMIGIVATTAPAASSDAGRLNGSAPTKNDSAAGIGRGALGRGQRDAEHEVVPGEEERQDRRGEDAGCRQRHDDLAERLPRGGAVDLGGLLHLPRDLAEERRQRPDRQRQREGHVGDDQPRPGVVEAERAPHVEQRPDQRDDREHRDHQRHGQHELLALELQAGDGVRRQRRDDHREQRGDEADADRVEDRPAELLVRRRTSS